MGLVKAKSKRRAGHWRAGVFWAHEGSEHDVPADLVAMVESDPDLEMEQTKKASKKTDEK